MREAGEWSWLALRLDPAFILAGSALATAADRGEFDDHEPVRVGVPFIGHDPAPMRMRGPPL